MTFLSESFKTILCRCVDSYVTATAEQVYQHIDVCGKQGQDLW